MILYQPLVIDISLYFHYSFFGLPLTYHLLNEFHFRTSNAHYFLTCERKHQVWVCIFLVRTWRIFWYQNYLGLLKIFVFAFSVPPFSMHETLHVIYKKYEIKNKCLVNTKYISSSESRTRENSDVVNTLDEIYLVFNSKK